MPWRKVPMRFLHRHFPPRWARLDEFIGTFDVAVAVPQTTRNDDRHGTLASFGQAASSGRKFGWVLADRENEDAWSGAAHGFRF